MPAPDVAAASLTFADFEAEARARGFDEVLEREWPPATVLDIHPHPFAVDALVVRGEMWLTVGADTRHLCAGDRFSLEAEVPHAERYGDAGVTLWVARRSASHGPGAEALASAESGGGTAAATDAAEAAAQDARHARAGEDPPALPEVLNDSHAPAASDAKAPAASGPASPAAAADLSPAACAARLAELFPALFTPASPKPLKLRIQADIQARSPGVFTRKALSAFLHRHTTGTAYLRALAEAAERIDLDGLPAGPVNDEHRQAAVAELQRRRALHEERRAAERQAHRKAHEERRAAERHAYRVAQDEARRAQAAEHQGWSERATLLRAYETTTLARANFCALKGLSEAELDAALAQARQDRERRTPPQRPLHPNGTPGMRTNAAPDPRTGAPSGPHERRPSPANAAAASRDSRPPGAPAAPSPQERPPQGRGQRREGGARAARGDKPAR